MKETPEYTKKSKYPSVTEVLSPWNDYSHVPEDRLEAAAERGTAVHAYCAAYARGVWAPTPPPGFRGYVDSFQRWFDLFVDETLVCEEEIEDAMLGYCGHPDLCVRAGKLGGVILTDLKTPIALKRRIWGCQLSAYERLLIGLGVKPDRVGSLQLSPEGRAARFEDFSEDLQEYFKAFFSALNCHKFFK